jgi:regulatory protein
MTMDDPESRAGAGRRPPRRVTPDHLENVALHYLQRFASSSANLRRVLMARVERSARAHGTDREEGARWVDALIERYLRSGLLDDRAYAEARAASLHRRGASARTIRQKLAAKGIDRDRAAAAVAAVDADIPGDMDLAAATALARRRRLGPFRRENREAHRQRDLAALGRAGFDCETARRVVDAADPDAIE